MKAYIRRMAVSDLDKVVKIEQSVFPDPWSRKSFHFEIVANRYSRPLVLIYNNRLIGYAVIWRIYEEFHIANIAIDPEFQGKGWGTYFLKEILKEAAHQEYALLEVREDNHKAIHIYEKLGFKKVGVRPRYYRNGANAILMKKELNSSAHHPPGQSFFEKQHQ